MEACFCKHGEESFERKPSIFAASQLLYSTMHRSNSTKIETAAPTVSRHTVGAAVSMDVLMFQGLGMDESEVAANAKKRVSA